MTAPPGDAIQIPFAIHHDAAGGSIAPTSTNVREKRIQNGLRPTTRTWAQLKDGAAPMLPASEGGAVEITVLIENEFGFRCRSVTGASKIVEHGLDPFAIAGLAKFEGYPGPVNSPLHRRTVEIAQLVEY